jgi:4-amino-4-deoxy-L-arabinose transferase-like glycosyltransferase
MAVIAILLLAAALRFVDLEETPPPFNVDEALHAYEAYAILHTGHDQWGTPWPVTFRAFNDYRRPAAIYTAVPFIAIYGLTIYAIRAMAAFWGWLSVVLIYRLARDLLGWREGLAAALLLTLSSWHVGFSRLGVEASGPLLVTVIAGLDFGWRWYRTRHRAWLLAAGMAFGASLYTYTITQAFTPLLLGAIALIFAGPLRKDLGGALAAALVVIVIAIPLVIALVTSPVTWNRLDAISVLSDPNAGGWTLALRQWLGHFSPRYLFISGDASPIHHIQGFGQLFWVDMLLAPRGLIAIFRQGRDRRAALLVLAWLVISAVPPALTRQDMGSPNSMRGIAGVGAWAIVSGIGLASLGHSLQRSTALRRAIATIAVIALFTNAGLVLHAYFTTYPVETARAFEYGVREAVEYVEAHADEVDTIVLTDWISQPHIFAVFFSAYDPEAFQRTHASYGDRLSEKLTAWGHDYRTGDVEKLYEEHDRALFIARPHMLDGIEPEFVVLHPDGTPAFKVLRR